MLDSDSDADDRFLSSLALALVDHPRATLQELAKAIGISKATLYRTCRTRDHLIERLLEHCGRKLGEATQTAGLQTDPPLEAFRRLITNHLEHRELTAFLMYYWGHSAPDSDAEARWTAAVDAFFLRGQREGVFRIDIPAPALTEICFSTMVGLMDAERRGRIARVGLAGLIEGAFLDGMLAK